MASQRMRTLGMIAAAFVGGAVVAQSADAIRGDGVYSKLGIFARALHYVQNNYVDEPGDDELVHGAIRGLMGTLDDRSAFLAPDELSALRKKAQRRFGGIGVLLAQEEKGVVVAALSKGAPADRAGLGLGDRILEVEGRPTTGVSADTVAEGLRGEPGTSVRLKVLRAQHSTVDPVVLEREPVAEPTVMARWLPDRVAYISIRSFLDTTFVEVQQALARFRSEGRVSRLILDLRDNSGGLLDQAVRVADLWIADGVIVSTVGRKQKRQIERAHPVGTEPQYPMLVLVNQRSASASEVLAGALQDHERARLMGQTTYGKGSVQTIIELEDGSALRLTVARYLTPQGRSLQGKGLSPDLPLPQVESDAREDVALRAALDHLLGRRSIRTGSIK